MSEPSLSEYTIETYRVVRDATAVNAQLEGEARDWEAFVVAMRQLKATNAIFERVLEKESSIPREKFRAVCAKTVAAFGERIAELSAISARLHGNTQDKKSNHDSLLYRMAAVALGAKIGLSDAQSGARTEQLPFDNEALGTYEVNEAINLEFS